jgi:hypothetical protein
MSDIQLFNTCSVVLSMRISELDVKYRSSRPKEYRQSVDAFMRSASDASFAGPAPSDWRWHLSPIERLRVQDIFQDCRIDPSYRTGREAEAFSSPKRSTAWIRATLRRDHLGGRQAVAAIFPRPRTETREKGPNPKIGPLLDASPAVRGVPIVQGVPMVARLGNGRGRPGHGEHAQEP